jgi:hypothetical protein
MPTTGAYNRDEVAKLISAPRFAAYLEAADSTASALDLYEWNASMASALFELVGHVEVILRNAIDEALQESLSESERRIPWFMLSLPKVQANLSQLEYRDLDMDRDRALSSLTMGFWANLVQSPKLWEDMTGAFVQNCEHEVLIHCIKRAHGLRNRLAHHASMLEVDVLAEVENLLELAGLVNSDARDWLSRLERATEVNGQRPVTVPDTVLIPASAAWPTYEKVAAYVCQAGRYFRPVKRLAFYYEGAIMRDVPKILERRDEVPWTEEEADRLRKTGAPVDAQVANAISYTRARGWDADSYQVFLLTRETPGALDHRVLPRSIRHERSGRGSAFVRKQRYFHYVDLASAHTTDDLPRSYYLADPLPDTSDKTPLTAAPPTDQGMFAPHVDGEHQAP